MKTENASSLKVLLILTCGLLLLSYPILQTGQCQNPPLTVSFSIMNPDGTSFRQMFTSIQQAINEAENGSTIYVPSGVYYERIVINKTVSLVGTDINTTVIDGSNAGTVVQILADNVSIACFTIRYSGWGWTNNGIYVHYADNCEIRNNYFYMNCHNIRLNFSRGSTITGNTIDGNGYGIRLLNSENCQATDNSVSNCIGGIHFEFATNCTARNNNLYQNSQGMRFYSPCTYNKVVNNIVFNNTYDGMIDNSMNSNSTFFNNIIFHNNFINNTYPFICRGSGNLWHEGYPSGGNFWSRYKGTDFYQGPDQNEDGEDGIGDTPYIIDSSNTDQYPLIHPWSLFPVRNINNGLGYTAIQEAINSSETLNRHVLWVDPGIYRENINIHKSLTLIGEEQSSTIIDGNGTGTVVLASADNVSVGGFTIQNSGSDYPPYGNDCGLLLDHCVGSRIGGNLITNNRIGIYLSFSGHTIIKQNVVSSNHENGIWLWYSGNNTLSENKILNNTYNFGVFGGGSPDFHNSIDSSNDVDGKPIYYEIGIRDRTFDNETEIGVLYLIDCTNVTARNLNLTNNGHGIFCYNVTNSTIKHVTATANNYGLYLQASTSNTAEGNLCSDNWVGICLQDSADNLVQGNIISGGEKGVSLYQANNNIVTGNSIRNAFYGIRVFYSSSNEISHNNLIDNVEQANLITSYQNSWDDGFEGNFWSDYTGTDANRDGVGDSVYVIDGANIDNHPLFGLFHNYSLHDAEDSFVAVVTNSSVNSFTFEASNRTIKMLVNGSNGSYGFCRMCIPHAIMEPSFTVIIDNGLNETIYPNYTIRDDGSRRWIYFAYQHSAHEVVVVPESWPPISLLILAASALLGLLPKIHERNRDLEQDGRRNIESMNSIMTSGEIV
jgi:parallel beta-helix repeat protein